MYLQVLFINISLSSAIWFSSCCAVQLNNILRLKCKSSAVFNHKGTNTLSSSHQSMILEALSVDECLGKCLLNTKCNALNVKPLAASSYTCKLLAEDSSNRSIQFSFEHGWNYYEARPLKDKLGNECMTFDINPCHPCRCFDTCGGHYSCDCRNVIKITLHSRGGRYRSSKIVIDGRNIKPRRGFNLVVVDHVSGDIDKVEWFDTYEKAEYTQSMIRFLDGLFLLKKKILLGCLHDDGSRQLTTIAEDNIGKLVGSAFQNLTFRESMAFIGYSDEVKPDFVTMKRDPSECIIQKDIRLL